MSEARKDEQAQWITSSQAADILTEKSGHKVSDIYVRNLARRGVFEVWTVSERTKLYLKSDVEKYIVGMSPGRRRKSEETAA